ncbi:TIGR02678 family protein [Actinomadura barringtoniae]|uniref:TIGR02678 family protein n=1 Tax=Actinomadura barringtoniae TaxID=1427535 RepID=A0A939T6S9_9ACTN|nr:TIGR02678 family protein [Actinomadura barringtoniae]MBO2451209.1 TIGR02678 family protein [Actinomadura barringtoniae]
MIGDFSVDLAAERRAAARLLLRHPLVTSESHPEDFPLIRRHADELTRQFGQLLGYRLVVEPGFARLLKAGLGSGAMRRLERASGTPFTPRTYAYLALALSVLVTAPEQLLLSEIVTRTRAAAAEADIDLGEPNKAVERRALVAALKQLMAWRVLAEDEGSVESYSGDGDAEALLTVDREIARRMVSGPIGRAASAAELVRLAAAPDQSGPRHAVRRRLVETPVVYVEDLTDEERDWLRRNQRREQRIFEDALGLDAEIRAEGVALIDPEGELSDIGFPGTGTVPWAALLLVERLIAALAPEGGSPEIPDRLIGAVLADLAGRHGGSWAEHYTKSPELLREDVLDLLHRMCLIKPCANGGWRLLAAAARYAPEVSTR